jgi:ABC-type phosphate transport system substrate-binding protein
MQRLISLVVAASCLSFGWLAAPTLAGRELAVIVHKASPAQTLTVNEVRAYYMKKQGAWSDGSKVRPVQQSGDVRDGFVKRTLGMSTTEFERYWLELKYSAAESPPKQVDSDDDVIRFVGAMKGAIGFVDAASLDPGALGKVKVVLKTGY